MTPSPAPNPLAKTVLPAPSSPHRQTRSPGAATPASAAASRCVASGLVVLRSVARRCLGGHRPERSRWSADLPVTPGLPTPAGCASDEALEVSERHGDRRPAGEPDEARLQDDAAREAMRAGEAGPATLGADERPRDDADEIGLRRGEIEMRVVDDEAAAGRPRSRRSGRRGARASPSPATRWAAGPRRRGRGSRTGAGRGWLPGCAARKRGRRGAPSRRGRRRRSRGHPTALARVIASASMCPPVTRIAPAAADVDLRGAHLAVARRDDLEAARGRTGEHLAAEDPARR